jgi:hypothetical protein
MIKAVGVDDYLMIAALVSIHNLYRMTRSPSQLFYTLSEAFAFDGIRITQGKSLLELLEVLTPGYRVCHANPTSIPSLTGTQDMYFGEVF